MSEYGRLSPGEWNELLRLVFYCWLQLVNMHLLMCILLLCRL